MWEPRHPVGVVVKQLAFTTQIANGADLQQEGEAIVDAMDAWWDNVRGWLEVITGQHITQVGHRPIEYLGNKTPVWCLRCDGIPGDPIDVRGINAIRAGRPVHEVTQGIFADCVSLADQGPKLAWILLRDARSLAEVGQHRRAVIDAATAAEMAITAMLDDLLNGETLDEATRMRKKPKMLKPKALLLGRLRGRPFPQSFFQDLVYKRNDAVHQGIPISPGDWTAAINEAVAVVETAFPPPTPPGASQPICRLW